MTKLLLPWVLQQRVVGIYHRRVLIPQAFAKYQLHIGIAGTAGFLLDFPVFHYI
jgi:hypothetical protein